MRPSHSFISLEPFFTVKIWFFFLVNFSVLFCLHKFSDSQLLSFSVLSYSNTCFNVCGSCLQEEEVAESGVSGEMNSWNEGCATLNMCCILFINARRSDGMPSLNSVSLHLTDAFANTVEVVMGQPCVGLRFICLFFHYWHSVIPF